MIQDYTQRSNGLDFIRFESARRSYILYTHIQRCTAKRIMIIL